MNERSPTRLTTITRRMREAVESYLGRFLVSILILLVAVTVIDRHEKGDFPSWSPDVWSAFADTMTATVAIIAVLVAVTQLKDARELRWEQASPYVVAFLEPDETDPKLIYLVIKNLGSTIAERVTIGVTPPPTRSRAMDPAAGEIFIPTQLPNLVPSQEWRTFWDFSVYRYEQGDLPDEHVATIRYFDSRNHEHEMISVLDWRIFTGGRRWIGRKSIHHVGESLKSIEKSIGGVASAAKQLAKESQARTSDSTPSRRRSPIRAYLSGRLARTRRRT
jgi:hypothetical protein